MSFLSSTRVVDMSALEARLGYCFQSPDLLRQALTHRSHLNEAARSSSGHNERLEFLGDAVLDLAISHHLMERLPDADEGTLSKTKSQIVSAEGLAAVAREIDLGPSLFLGKGEEKTEGRAKRSLLANGLEAVIGAVYLDGGWSVAKTVILRLFDQTLQTQTDELAEVVDYKTTLQEQCQKAFGRPPTYRLSRVSGPDHERIFAVEILINDVPYGDGVGRSKKEAEQQAAAQVLRRRTVASRPRKESRSDRKGTGEL